ncbi:transmembrane protein 131-like [Osmerus eperlanus]|uniref:transmembrane protein 131-like n=1 Tax=Osmerus eperlanus TaxID=29151 RepID=UPI002E12B4AC
MAQAERSSSNLCPTVGAKWLRLLCFRVLFYTLFHIAQANKQAFIQTDTILEVFHFGDESLLQKEPEIDITYHHKSSSLQRGNSRPIRFEPSMLDFHEQPVGMPKMEKVYLHNSSPEEISLISISATTAHFHASFFENRIILPGGNTSFDVVFLARVVGNVENTLFINTSHHGVFTYQVFGVGIPNPYRLRPFIGARVPVNSSFSPLINIHNPHSEPLQVVEMYTSGGDLHLELPTGQQGGTHNLWEIPPFETKGVMRASFSSRDADNHTAFIRIKTNASDPDQFIILPVEVEVTSAPGIYSSIEMLDFGTLRSQDKPKQLNLHLLNSGAKDVQITSVRATPSNDAITIDFKGITLKAGENRYTKVASIHFDASKVQKQTQSSGKITVKAKEKSYSKLEIPYQAEVLDGYLGFDHTVTLFHIRDSVTEPVVKLIHLTNTFHFAIHIHHVALPEEANTMFKVQNFSEPVLIPPQESRYIFSLHFRPVRPSTHIDSNILLVTNASRFHLPIRAYTGFLEALVLFPSLHEHLLDFGVLSATDTSSILFAVVNSNPIELVLQPWLVTGENLNVELLKIEKGNRTTVQAKSPELQNATATSHKTVILASGYCSVFRVTLVAKDLEGPYDGAIHITTDYEILTIPVKAVIAVGTLTSYPKHIVLPPSFPGKVVHHSFSIVSSFSQRVRLLQINALTDDKRFYYRRLKTSRDELEPKRKSKVAKIYFDSSLQCGDHCYVGVQFVLKSEARPSGLGMQEDMWDSDVDLYQMLRKKWKELQQVSGNIAEAVFEANADLQKIVQTKISAELTWPSIINSSRQLLFPLTSINSSSEMEVILGNPADVPVYIQILPLALYPNLCSVTSKLAQMFPLERLPHFNPNTLEFHIDGNNKSLLKSSEGFSEGSTQPYVYNLPLLPEGVKSLRVKFSPVSNHTVTSLLMIRNNLTVVEFLVVQGQGSYERLKLGGKSPGPGAFLRFKMSESHLKECSDKMKSKEPNFTLRRSFKIENTGQLLINIRSIEINGRACEGFGFKVLSCQEFALKPNASKDIVILFTPDFTASRVIRELKLVTAGGSRFVFALNASLPYHMLASCAATLPRPNWELELYIIISVIMSSMFLLVVVTAYLEALGIWEMFKRRMCFETSSNSMETGKPFDLREIVRLQSDSHLNDYAESTQHPLRGTTNPVSRAGSRHARGGHSRASNQPSVPSSQPGPKASESTPSPSQLASRKARSTRQPQPVPGPPEIQTPSPATPPAPLPGPLEAAQRLPSEEQDYMSLVEAMDKDLDRPEASAEELAQDQTSVQAKANGIKGKLQRKPKSLKRKEERELRTKGRTQGEELPREDNDDTSSTTTETSNPDTESGLREEMINKKSRSPVLEKAKEETAEHSKSKNKKPVHTKDKTLNDAKSSSLELPYVTPLENKRKIFNSKTVLTQALANSSPTAAVRATPPKPRAPVPYGKLEDRRPSPLAKFLSNESGSSSGSEGEKDVSPPPEWDCVPLFKTHSAVDSMQQISMQTMNADLFLKRPIGTPLQPCVSTCDSFTTLGFSVSDSGLRDAPGTKCKLTKSVSLPGQNGNPTFAAVAAGYDKSPGGSSAGKAAVSRPDFQGKNDLPLMTSVESDSSDSSGLWSPVGNGRSPSLTSINSFSAFGSSNTFNLSGVFSGMTSGRSVEPQQSWPDFSRAPAPSSSSTGSVWPSEALQPWPCSSSSPSTPTTSILGGGSSLWSSSPPFSPSIWSTSADSAPLHSFTPPPTSPLSDLIGSSENDGQSPGHTALAQNDLSPTYNPWSMWRPTFSRRSSEPWPNASDGNP